VNLNREPYFYQQWYLDKNDTFYQENNIDDNASIHISDTLQHYSGKEITIAIIDDGLDVSHEEINSSIVATYDIATQTSIVSHTTPNGYHGTAITGIIAADANAKGIVGIARESRIVFLKYREGIREELQRG